ncbi:uncharacterized protein [Dysidea avara]|uniref:uncharacterized protein isoform X2 n=1 Tax=Dysidea avara TaxID=196820 RepID=UPI0033212596
MARKSIARCTHTIAFLLLLAVTLINGQMLFSVVESEETVTIGNAPAGGSNYRFEEVRCREIFTVDDLGVIRSNGGIDRERVAKLFPENTDEVNHDMAGCQLDFTSSSGHSSAVRIEVAVLDINDNSPQFTFPNDVTRYEVRENKPANSTILIFSVSDPDKGDNGSVVDVQMSGVDNGIFYLFEELVEEETRFLRVTLLTNSTHAAINFETNEQFNITFVARDRGTPMRTNTTTVILDIQDENEGAPIFGMTSYEVTINETTPVGHVIVQVSATDMDGGEFGIVQYTLEPSNEDIRGQYAINAMTGEIYLKKSVENFTTNTVHNVLVQSYNGNFTIPGNMAGVRITIARAGDLPQFRIGSDIITSYNDVVVEGNDLLTPNWSVDSDMDSFNFTVQFDGVAPDYDLSNQYLDVIKVYSLRITFINVDRETTPVITGSLIATDTEFAALTSSLHFSITVLDINDNPPLFITTNVSVSENQPVGYKVGDIVARDPDLGENGTVDYLLLHSSHPEILSVEMNGSIIVRGVVDFEQAESIQLLVMARDQGSPFLSTNQSITVSIININEHAPLFVTKDLAYVVFVNTTSFPVTLTVNATDGDTGLFGEVTYGQITESNNASSFVSINTQSGDITINAPSTASAYPYLFSIVATDGGGLSSMVTFSIYVWTDFCEQNPCDNEATCINIDNDYMCECADDIYGGRNCSTVKFPCNSSVMPQPCTNDGHCTNINNDLDYMCTCVNGYSGRNCQYSAVSFRPRSYLTYTGISPSFNDLNLTLQILPKSLNGLIFYAVEDENNFVTLELKDGEVIARTLRTGDSRAYGMVATNNSWYQVELTISEQTVSVEVRLAEDGINGFTQSSADTQRLLDDRIQIHVGGVPADIPVPMYHASSRNYIGCMRDLIVDGDRIGLSGESKDERRTASHNVEDGCRDQPLEKCNGCEGEACVDYLMEGKPYCDCEVVGAICETAAPSSLVSFTGNNREADLIIEPGEDFYLALKQSRHTRQDVEQVTFQFRTTNLEAVVLSSKIEDSNGNLGVFWFDNSSVHYYAYQDDQNDLPCDRVTVEGHFNDDDWHTVVLTIRSDVNITLVVDNSTSSDSISCRQGVSFVGDSSKITVSGVSGRQDGLPDLPDKDYYGCVQNLKVDDVPIILDPGFRSQLVNKMTEGRIDAVSGECLTTGGIEPTEDTSPFLELYIIVVIAVSLLLLVILCVVVIIVCHRCLHNRPHKSSFDMSQETPHEFQDSPPGTMFRSIKKKTEFDNASVGHYQEEGEETMPDAAAISINSLRKSVSVACNSTSSGTGSGETGFHTGSERDRSSDVSYPEPTPMMANEMNEETGSEVQSEYSTFVSDSDITSAVEQTLSPPDIQLLGPPNVLGIQSQARNMPQSMRHKPSSLKDPTLSPLERKVLSPYHPHGQLSRFSMSTIESGSESSLGPSPDTMLNYPHQPSLSHEPQLPGLKTLCGPNFNPISYWEQQSRLKPSIDPDYPLQRLSLASGRGTEEPSSTVSVASTLDERHEFASQGGGEGEATNMRDGLESDHELDYRLADLQIPEYESMTLSQSTLVGGSEDYFPEAAVKPCHPIPQSVRHNSVPRSPPYHMPSPNHSPQSISSSSYGKNSSHRLLSEQDLSAHNRYQYHNLRTAPKPPHMISDHGLHAQYSSNSTSSASTPQTARAWRSEDPINV